MACQGIFKLGWDYPGKGKVKFVRTPIMIDGRLPETRRQALQLGEHTHEILVELGYTPKEIQELLDQNIAFQQTPQPLKGASS